ncbi:MAG: Maf family protein [Acidobacteriota bacterium]|nr:Maf family protein [Acidobacteriota bacterium]
MFDDKCSMINLPKLILASASPRRSEILTAVGWEFEKRSADIDETELPAENPADYVQRLAKEKAEAVAVNYQNALILGADTTVVIENCILGKPANLDDARRMLKMLSGNWHEVLTGAALVKKSEPSASADGAASPTKTIVGIQKTKVKFAALSDAEIEFLIEHGAPLDKAGAYAVQAQAALFIERIEGDYWNVVGLPVSLIYELLREF